MTKKDAVTELLKFGCWPELAVWLAYGLSGKLNYAYCIAVLCGVRNWSPEGIKYIDDNDGLEKTRYENVTEHSVRLIKMADKQAQIAAEAEKVRS